MSEDPKPQKEETEEKDIEVIEEGDKDDAVKMACCDAATNALR